MTEEEYQADLNKLRAEWGQLYVDPASPGILRATKDPFTGLLAGLRAPIIAEIMNRAIRGADQ